MSVVATAHVVACNVSLQIVGYTGYLISASTDASIFCNTDVLLETAVCRGILDGG